MVPRFRDYMELRSSENDVLSAVQRLYGQGVDPFAFLGFIRDGHTVENAKYLAEMNAPGTPPAQAAAKPNPQQVQAASQALMTQLGKDPKAIANLNMLMQAAGVPAAPAPGGSTTPGPVAGKPQAQAPGQPAQTPPATPGKPAPAPAQTPGQPAQTPAATPGKPAPAPAQAPGQPAQPGQPGQPANPAVRR